MRVIRTSRVWGLIALAWVLFSCNWNAIKVSRFEPAGEVRELQSFTIEFDEPVAPAEKLDQWLTEQFLTFEPALDGKYKWTSPSTLVFSPSGALDPAQTYAVRINEPVASFGDKEKDFTGKTFYFHTANFEATGADIFWKPIEKTDYHVTVGVRLHFSYRVSPDDLQRYLEVKRDGKEEKNFTVAQDGTDILLNFNDVQQTDADQKFVVTLKKGLLPTFKRNPLSATKTFALKLPPVTRLTITGASGGVDGETAWLEVYSTQALDKDHLAEYLEITPKPEKMEFVVNDNSARIEGSFMPGNDYSIVLKKGAPGLYGGTLERDFAETVTLADLDPSVRFTDRKGMYLLRNGLENIGVFAVNMERVEFHVHEIFRNNIIHFFNNNYSYSRKYIENYSYGDEEDGGEDYYSDYSYYEAENYGREIFTEKVGLAQYENKRQDVTFNLRKAITTQQKGIFLVQVTSDEDYWMRDAKIVVLTDLGIIAKRTDDELLVFVNSLTTADPVSGVNVKLISTNNQTLLQGTTDGDGIVRFADLRKSTEGFDLRMIVAEYGEDFSFADLKATRVETSRFDVGGKQIAQDGYDGFIYADRNLYRPGETAYLSAIVRDVNIGIVKDVPMNFRVVSPTGRILLAQQQQLNEQGSFEVPVTLPQYAQTGQYTAELYTGNDKFITSYKFSVEDFVPDQLRVSLNADKDDISMGESVNIALHAEYMFGSPCKDNKYETDIRLTHKPFVSKKYPKYDFSNYSTQDTRLENDLMEGKLDEQGNATITYTAPDSIQSGGYLDGGAFTAVFDGTGRTVNRVEKFKVFTKNYFIGTEKSPYYFGTNKPLTFNMAAVNAKDQPISVAAEVELIRYEWHTILQRSSDEGNYRYASEETQITEWKRDVNLNGATPFNLSVSKSGRYEMRIRKKGEEDYIRKTFYAYYYGNSTASSFEIDKEGEVDIILDKDQYKVGETAKALFVAPFTGKMLVTVERDRVLEHHYVEVKNNSAELKIPITADHSPNVYITATLFRPYKERSSIPFMVGHGFANVSVSKPGTELPVKISAPEKVKPRTTQYVTVTTAPERDIFVTLAAVDEGILQIKNYATPDPYNYMYAKRQLMVESFDMYKYMLPEMESSSMAGGDEYSSGKRLNPIKSKRFKLVALWSGIKRTDANGTVRIPITLPQFNGEVRLMAVAYSGNRFGSADKPMKVADDVILMPSIPRFLSQRDSLSVPVNVMNTTNKAGEVSVTIKTEGPMKVVSEQTQRVSVPAEGSANVRFALKTWDELGEGKITFTTSGIAKVSEEIEIGVRPTSPFMVESNSGDLAAGSTFSLALPNGWLQGTQKATLSVSPFPGLKLGKALRYLLGYPHGCIEQTTSKAFPQLYFADLAAVAAPEFYQKGNAAYFVKEAIRKIEGMQLYDGSFSYWQGGGGGSMWGSVYATHFLLEARKAGFEVNKTTLENAMRFLSQVAADKTTYDYMVFTSQSNRETRKIARKESLYSLYVLSLGGQPDFALMNYYRARPQLLSGDSRYLLAGAFALAKRWNVYSDLIPRDYTPEAAPRENDGSFDSDIRANGIMLNVLMDVDPTNKLVPLIAKYLGARTNDYYSTQDNAWAFLALGKVARSAKQSDVTVEVQADGKTLATLPAKGGSVDVSAYTGKNITMKSTGSGSTFFFWNAEGIKKNMPVKQEDRNMKVRRSYYTRTGQAITNNQFKQGDLIVCKISLTGGNQSVANIAISDLLPSGFEIENPRIGERANLLWVSEAQTKNGLSADYLDVRDDRLLLYTNIEANATKDYYYLIRVVNAGAFSIAPIAAESMYDPNYHSYAGGGWVKVLPM